MSVSIVMATYNGEKYIEEQLNSIVCQLSKDDEIIISDDCSTDSTVEILENYFRKNKFDFKVELIRNTKNLGFQDNFNKVIQKAEKDYIFFSDQDDVWSEDKVSKMVSIMEEQRDCKVLCCEYEPWCMDSQVEIPKYAYKNIIDDGSVEKILFDKQKIYIGSLGCCMCVRRKFRDEISNFWFDNWAQDDRFWKLSLCAEGLYVYHKVLIKHRIHSSNTATYGKYHTIEKREKLFDSMYQASKQMCNFSSDSNANMQILTRHNEMMGMRLQQLENLSLKNSFKLIKFLSYYQKKKSYLVEIFMIIRGK